MDKTIAIVATLDTKGYEAKYLNWWGERAKPLVPQVPLAEPAYLLRCLPC